MSKLKSGHTVARMQATTAAAAAAVVVTARGPLAARTIATSITASKTGRVMKSLNAKASAPSMGVTRRTATPTASASTTTTAISKNRSPFSSFITTGFSVRNRCTTQSKDFAYDLSNDELRFMGSFKSPMKAVPDGERELLKSGQRGAYLALRYEHSPDRKYNFPEATSWRIGWFHNQQKTQPSGTLKGH